MRLTLVFGVLFTLHVSASPLSSDPWGSDQAPFSFTYEGKDSSQFLSSWKKDRQTVAGRAEIELTRTSYVDPRTGLRITAEVRDVSGYDATEWVLKFKNEGTADTPILDGIQTLDWTIPLGGSLVVHHPHGSQAEPQDFKPQDEALTAGKPFAFSSSDGRSSRGNMPFFNLQGEGGGIVGAIGWTGDWLATFTPSADGKSVRLQAGQWKTHLVLHPGEEILTPRIVLMNWKGNDWMVAQNEWRKLMLAHYTVQVNGRPIVGPLSYGTWGADTAEHKLAQIKLVQDEKLPFDVFWIDAAWYDKCVGHDMGKDASKEPFWRGRGSWATNPANYPDGLKPVGDAARAAGMKFLLWLEPEEADPGTLLRQKHDDWFYHPANQSNEGTAILKLSDPMARAGMTNIIDRIITQDGLDWYRQDFNANMHNTWAAADTPDRVGVTEIEHVEGLYEMWDDLVKRHPGLLIDNCSSGGQRIDIETCSRSTPLWRSDMAGPPDSEIHNQTQTQGLAPWVPLNGCCPWTTPGPFDEDQAPPDPFDAKLIYGFRSGYSAAMVVGIGQAQGKDHAWCAKLRQQLAEYKHVQPYIYGDFYPLLDYSTAPDAFVAWQWDRPDRKSGVVIALRRDQCGQSELALGLHALDPAADYEVEIRPGLDEVAPQVMKGSDLANLHLTIRDQPGSVVVFYRSASKTKASH